MRLSTLTGAFCIGAATAVQATLPCSSVSCLPHDGPVPSIGPGIPLPLVAGAVLCGMMLVKSWRRS